MRLADGESKQWSRSKSARGDKSFNLTCIHEASLTQQHEETTTGLAKMFLSDPVVFDQVSVPMNSAPFTLMRDGLRPSGPRTSTSSSSARAPHQANTQRNGAASALATTLSMASSIVTSILGACFQRLSTESFGTRVQRICGISTFEEVKDGNEGFNHNSNSNPNSSQTHTQSPALLSSPPLLLFSSTHPLPHSLPLLLLPPPTLPTPQGGFLTALDGCHIPKGGETIKCNRERKAALHPKEGKNTPPPQ